MLKSQKKNSLIINNAIELGELTTEANGKGRKFTSRFIEAGVAHYEQFGDVLITKETLDKFIDTMIGVPVIIKHKDITDKNADKERVGVVSRVWYNEADGWFYCEGVIWDKQAIDLVKNQGWNVSCTYDFESDFKKSTYHGKEIDMEFTGGEFLHLALVPNPRYERATIVMNAKDDEHWITINGNHILIKDKGLAEFLGTEKKSYAQFNTALSVYKNANKENKELQEEIKTIQANIKENIEKEIKSEQKEYKDLENSPKVQNLKRQIEKYIGKNATLERIDSKGYEWSIGASNGEGIDSITATKLVDSINTRSTFLVADKYGFYANAKKCYIKVKVKEKKMIENAKDWDGNEGEWITIKGNHLFIKKGQSKDEAVKEFIDKQEDKSGSKEQKEKETKKEETKEDPNTKDFKNHLDRIEKLIKKYNLEPHEEDELLDELASFEMKFDEGLEPHQEDALREELYDFEDDIRRHHEMNKKAKNSLEDALCEVLAEALTEE